MAQLVITLMFAALTAFAARAIMLELTRPLHQPWLTSGFVGQVSGSGVRPANAATDLGTRRNRARVAAMARQVRPQRQPSFAAAA
jgi:hypothetical protein